MTAGRKVTPTALKLVKVAGIIYNQGMENEIKTCGVLSCDGKYRR